MLGLAPLWKAMAMDEKKRLSNDEVQHELERLVLTGELRPGEHVKEQMLADRMGIGRAPVREACRALERAGLLRRVANRGVFVRRVSLSGAADLFDIRAELSAIVAREAVQNVEQSAANDLQSLINSMDSAAAAADADHYLDLNLQFHERLYRLANNRRVLELDRALGKELLIYRRRGLASGGGLQHSNIEHRRLLEALLRSREDELTQALRQHILNGKRRFLQAIGSDLEAPAPFSAGRMRSKSLLRTQVPSWEEAT